MSGEQLHNFGWAIEQMKKGRVVARDAWGNKWFRWFVKEVELPSGHSLGAIMMLKTDIHEETPIDLRIEKHHWDMHKWDMHKDLLAEDWRIWDPPGYHFAHVLYEILYPEANNEKPEKKFRRKGWPEGCSIFTTPNKGPRMIYQGNPFAVWEPVPEDLTATDWVEHID